MRQASYNADRKVEIFLFDHSVKEKETLTGGVEDVLTTKEPFLEDPNGDWFGLAPRICLAVSTEDARQKDISACVCVAISCCFCLNKLTKNRGRKIRAKLSHFLWA